MILWTLSRTVAREQVGVEQWTYHRDKSGSKQPLPFQILDQINRVQKMERDTSYSGTMQYPCYHITKGFCKSFQSDYLCICTVLGKNWKEYRMTCFHFHFGLVDGGEPTTQLLESRACIKARIYSKSTYQPSYVIALLSRISRVPEPRSLHDSRPQHIRSITVTDSSLGIC